MKGSVKTERFFLYFCADPSLNLVHLLPAGTTGASYHLSSPSICPFCGTSVVLPQEIVLPAADIFELLPGDIPVLVICPCPALPPVLIMPWFLHVAFLHPIPGLCLLFLGSRFEMKIAGLCRVKLCRPEHCFNRERTVVGLVPACQDPTLCHGFACHLCADHSQSLWYLSLLS